MRTRNLGRKAKFLDALTSREAAVLLYDWTIWARAKQLPPNGDWRTWLILAGRGFGKTRTGAEWVRHGVEAGAFRRVALVGETSADVRDVMVEGDSGILKVCPPWNRPKYEPSKRRLTWPNGAVAQTFSADDPEQLRGPQFDAAWADEIAKWRYVDSWDNLMLGLRLGPDPRCVATTTPRPRAWLVRLIDDPGTTVTTGGTQENAANLAPAFIDQIMRTYGGSRLARQEIDGVMLLDTPGALWRRADIDRGRVSISAAPTLSRIVVAIDPAVSTGVGSDETGIIVAGIDGEGVGHVLEDLSGKFSPDTWARRAIQAFHHHAADTLVAEVNQGGDLVIQTLRTVDPLIPVRAVRASRGKRSRAEPIAALYEQGRVRHVGALARLEDQLCAYTGASGEASPDRLDALVWAMTDLMLGHGPARSEEFLV
jgi:phage terminase large subunit-like protein